MSKKFIDIVSDYQDLLKYTARDMDKFEAFNTLITGYIDAQKLAPKNYNLIGELWKVFSEYIDSLNDLTKEKNITVLKKLSVWDEYKKAGKMKKPVILRMKRCGPYDNPYSEVYLAAVNEKGETVANLINFSMGKTPTLMPRAKEYLERSGYYTDFAEWNEYGSLQFGQLKHPSQF